MQKRIFWTPLGAVTLGLLSLTSTVSAQEAELSATSLNSEIEVVPAPGPVVIDGKTNDWDLSAGVWSYNNPVLAQKTSVWTHLMWDEKGIYFLARYADRSPMKNGTMGKDFAKSWQGDAYQARVIFDDHTPDEHQMHMNLFYSTPEKQAYMLVKHGGFKSAPPYDETGPDRPDLAARFGPTMEKAGGKIAFSPWDDGQGYNCEAFWPWSYVRLNGQPLKPGDQFTFGIEAMWGTNDGSNYVTNRLADGIKNDKVNRIFMFRARDGWGKAVISAQGHLDVSQQQEALQVRRVKQFVNYDTVGSIPIRYTLDEDRDVTVAIDNAQGVRVRNLFGQYPRKKGENQELWDGLDDDGKPVTPGQYTVTILDHKPIQVRLVNSLYNAGTPPWRTDSGQKLWGANHGYPTTVATRGDVTIVGFTGTEGTTGIMRINDDGRIQWTDTTETLDATLDDKFAYVLSRDSWTRRTILRRFDLTTGRLTPFDDADRSPDSVLLPNTDGVPDGSSLAFDGKNLLANLPGKGLFQIDPATGKFSVSTDALDLVALTDREGELYGLMRDGTVAKIDSQGHATQKLFVAKGLGDPVRLAVKQDKSEFAISDRTTNQVFEFNAKGKRIRTLGAAYAAVDGMRPAGDYIETNFINPLGLDYDATGRLWVAEGEKHSKRVTCWTPDGKLARQYWGGADYGAMAGFPVTYDATKFLAHGVEFQLDPNPSPAERATAEKPLRFHPQLAETRGFIYRIQGREYAVSTPGYNGGDPEVLVALRDKNGIFVPCVRFTYPNITKDGKRDPGSGWVDRNGDGKAEPDEIVTGVKGSRAYWSNGWIRPDLTFITQNSVVYAPQGFSPTGVPLYDFAHPAQPANALPFKDGQGSVGTIVMDGAGNISDGIRFATLDGHRGAYPNRYERHNAPAAQRGVLIAPFRTNGVVENVPGVGAITALGGDRGEWFLMSMDGLYISSILQDSKGEVTLDETFTGQESFGGFLWRDEKGRVLTQLGGASYRIMEITGLDTTRKNKMTLEVSADQIAKGSALVAASRSNEVQEPTELRIARVAALPAAPVAPTLDKTQPLLAGASDFRVQEAGNPARWFRAALAHDGTNLAIEYQVNDPSPWKNSEGRFTHAFIGGDSVDLMLDIPGRGPIRLLAAPVTGQNTVVYWQKQAARPDNPMTYVVANNMTNAQKFDVVKRLTTAKIGVQTGEAGYSVLITVPLAELGLDPAKMNALKGTVGVIYSDPSGTNRAARLYWFNKNTDLVSDVPSESALNPGLWGKVTLDK